VLLTGRDTGHAQIRDNIGIDAAGREIRPALAVGTVTVARRLQAAGYATACIGKWGLGDEETTGLPWLQGFERFYGYLHNTHGTRYYTEFIHRNADKIALRGNYGNWRKQYGPDLLLDEALRFMEVSRDRPFYLHFTPNLVHGQYVDPPPDPELPPVELSPGVELTEKERAYTAMVRRLDRDVGRLVQKIDALGLGRDTLVIFTSDNGGRGLEDRNDALFRASGGLRGGKADLYEGGIRVPMIARWTGRVAPGGATAHLSGFVDFLATTCDLAGVPVGGPTEGLSYAPVFRGMPQPEHKYLYWELAKRDEPWVVPLQALRAGPWKLLRTGGSPPVLFNIADDPAETRDLATVRPEVVARLVPLLEGARTDDPLFPLKSGPGFE
jgi:arylsulfatase A-like enzyme